MSDLFLRRIAAEAGTPRRTSGETNTPATGPAGRAEQPEGFSRAGLLPPAPAGHRDLSVLPAGHRDLAALPAGRVLPPDAITAARAKSEPDDHAAWRDDLDPESVCQLALLVKQQLSLQALAIANVHALGILGMVQDLDLM